jgi:hypothetical protein
MNELRALAQGEQIGSFVENPPPGLSVENVSGVGLRIDDYWLSWDLSRPGWIQQGQPPTTVLFSPIGMGPEFQRHKRMFFGARYDFDSSPNDWAEYCARSGYVYNATQTRKGAHPVAVVVILRKPLSTIFKGGDYPQHVGPHPIIYEHRKEAEGYALNIGGFLGGAHEGTLGGFLWHKVDLTYHAVSCAHVLGNAATSPRSIRAYSPKPTSFGSRKEIGDVTWSQMPPPSGTTKCNSRTDPNAPTVDVAYAIVDSSIVPDLIVPRVGKINMSVPISTIGQSDPVSFVGQKSKKVDARVKEVTIWKELTLNGLPYCFKDIFALEHRNYQYIGQPLGRPGDSGAWVINVTSNVVGWDGMVIGGDGQNLYCCYAENIMSALQNPDLQLPP